MIASFRKILVTLSSLLLLTACNSTPLKYQLDPEINNLDKFNPGIKIIAVTVIDSRVDAVNQPNSSTEITGPEDAASILTKSLTTILKANGMKIISKPLLADLSIKIEIQQLQLQLKQETFKSIMTATSKITVTLNKHSQQWSKIFSDSRNQEVANPANSLDATGVINQMLSKQLSSVFADAKLKQFIDTVE